MGRFANMAEQHWKEHLPDAYDRIADKTAFFAEVEDEAASQMLDLEEHLRGQDPPGESWADRMGRFVRARATAEEIVVREVILTAPSSPEVETASDDSDTESEDSVAEFYRLREQFYAELDEERAGREQGQESGP